MLQTISIPDSIWSANGPKEILEIPEIKTRHLLSVLTEVYGNRQVARERIEKLCLERYDEVLLISLRHRLSSQMAAVHEIYRHVLPPDIYLIATKKNWVTVTTYPDRQDSTESSNFLEEAIHLLAEPVQASSDMVIRGATNAEPLVRRSVEEALLTLPLEDISRDSY